MVGGESRGMTPHSSTEFGGRQLIQRPFRRSTAADVGTAVHNSSALGIPSTELCAWMPELRAKQTPEPEAYPGYTGRRSAVFRGAQEAFRRENGGASGRKKGKKPLFCTQQGWLGRHLSGKQPVKDGGVCRVIGTISRGSKRKEPHISGDKSRNQPHFLTRI